MAELTRLGAISLILLLSQAGVARADAIDGARGAADGQPMSIKGASIPTPGGKTIEGHYTRHAFDYVVPPDAQGSGEAVNILLRGEYLAVSRLRAASAQLQELRRCRNDRLKFVMAPSGSRRGPLTAPSDHRTALGSAR